MSVRLLESASLMNVAVVSAGTLFKWECAQSKTILLEVSIVFAFAQFCAIIVWSLVRPYFNVSCKRQMKDVIVENYDIDDIIDDRNEDSEITAPLYTWSKQLLAIATQYWTKFCP